MRKLFAQLSKESFVYGLSAAAAKLIGLVLVPLYTRSLSQSDFGVLELLITGTGILSALLILGLDNATALSFYNTEDEQERGAIASAFLYFELALTFTVSGVLFLLAGPMASLLLGDPAYTVYVQLAVVIVPFATLVTMFLDIARLVRKPSRYVAISVGNLILTACLVLLAVIVFRLGIEGILAATLAGSALFSLVGWLLTRPSYGKVFSMGILRRLLLLGLPVVPATMAYWVINFSNRWFLFHIDSSEQVAILALATRLSAPVVLIVTAFQIAWVPFSLSIARESAAEGVYARTLAYFLALTFSTLLLLTLFAGPLVDLFATSAYLPATQVLALVGMSSIASGAYYIVATGVNLSGKTIHLGWTAVVAALASIALNLLLIPTLGVVGAAVAGLIANFLPVILLYLVAQRLHRVPYDLRRISLLIVVALACLAAATMLQGQVSTVNLVLRLACMVAFIAALVPVGVIGARELREIRRLLRLGAN